MPGKTPTAPTEVVNANTLRLLMLGYSRTPNRVGDTSRVWTDADMNAAAESAAAHINATANKFIPQGEAITEADLVNAVRALLDQAPASATNRTKARTIVRMFKGVRLLSGDTS